MTDEELLEIVDLLQRRGTDFEFVEAKSARTALPKHLWQTLSAFANQRRAGVIVLGLDESQGFSITGIDDPGKMQANLASLCDKMEPVLRPLLRIHETNIEYLVKQRDLADGFGLKSLICLFISYLRA